MKQSKCRAKDPSKCVHHGTNQGIIAYERIQKVLEEKPKRYYLDEEERKVAPLKKLTPVGLTLALTDYVKREDLDEAKINYAIALAAELHQTDIRSGRAHYDKTSYIEHPLRNTVRATRYGVTDEATLIGSLLHDTVEDHPFEIAEKAGVITDDEHEARKVALEYIGHKYGEATREMVEGMSNPISENKYMPAAEKNKIYAQHVEEAVTSNKRVLVGKVCDFVDNAVGLVHNQNTMNPVGIKKRATKYLLVCDVLINELKKHKGDKDFPATDEGIDRMISQINSGKRNLLKLSKINVD